MILKCLICFVTVHVAAGDELRPLLRAIRAVETAGSGSGRAVGDRGRSIGPYQISYSYWVDSRIRGTWERCHGRAYSEAVMLAYWKRHCPDAVRQRKFEALARIHNGSPNGQEKRTTFSYWQKVRRAMQGRVQG